MVCRGFGFQLLLVGLHVWDGVCCWFLGSVGSWVVLCVDCCVVVELVALGLVFCCRVLVYRGYDFCFCCGCCYFG